LLRQVYFSRFWGSFFLVFFWNAFRDGFYEIFGPKSLPKSFEKCWEISLFQGTFLHPIFNNFPLNVGRAEPPKTLFYQGKTTFFQ